MPNQKRIISIEIENYRAYPGTYPTVSLDDGENLLIYGENGSGKSSLFKAINNFFANSLVSQIFIKNRYFPGNDGKIAIEFDDFNSGARLNTPAKFQFGSALSNNGQLFIQNAALVKGFLDYTSLLDVYFKKERRPNLFSLIVLGLLGEHISSSTGATYKFGVKWQQLQNDLINRARNRRSRCHKDAKRELPTYETHLRGTLNRVFVELNRLLATYFADLGLEVDYDLASMNFHYSKDKYSWRTPAELHFVIRRDGVVITDSYTDYLNEARLSAFAICIYLASLKINPTNIELKVLYLDDVFIGLDAANRIPIMNILKNEFADYQIFLSTYDRHTYEVAKRSFAISYQKWKCIELYVGSMTVGATTFDKPIVISDYDNYSRALFFLHNGEKPDYPAAANYFRKYAEEILENLIPTHELREDDNSIIAGYQLTKLVNAGIKFLVKIGYNPTLLQQLKNALPTLLHPLSHFNLSSPIYKKELLEVQNLLPAIESMLKHVVTIATPTFHSNHTLTLDIRISAALTHRYRIIPKEMFYVISEVGVPKRLSSGGCYCRSMCPVPNGGPEGVLTSLIPTDPRFQYTSISDSYDKLFDYNLATFPGIVKAADYTSGFSLHIEGNLTQLADLLV